MLDKRNIVFEGGIQWSGISGMSLFQLVFLSAFTALLLPAE